MVYLFPRYLSDLDPLRICELDTHDPKEHAIFVVKFFVWLVIQVHDVVANSDIAFGCGVSAETRATNRVCYSFEVTRM